MYTHRRQGLRRWARGVVLLTLYAATAGRANAQPRDLGVIAEANGGSVWVKVQVFIPLLGWVTLPVSQTPIAHTKLTPTGGNTANAIADLSVGLGTLPVLGVSGVNNDAVGSAISPKVDAMATSHVSEATILGGLVQVKGLVTHVGVDGESRGVGDREYHLTGTTYVEELVVAGTPIRIGELPPNLRIPIVGVLTLPVLGVPLSVPVSASVTLNEQAVFGTRQLTVNAVRVAAEGEILGLVKLAIDISLGGTQAEIATAPPPEGIPLPTPENPNPTRRWCKAPGATFADVEAGCAAFYECDQDYRPFRKACAPGQLFSEQDNACVPRDLVTCVGAPAGGSGVAAAAGLRALAVDEGFECPSEGMYPHPDCAKFYHCSNGIAYEKDCTANWQPGQPYLHWNDAKKECDYPDEAGCEAGTNGLRIPATPQP